VPCITGKITSKPLRARTAIERHDGGFRGIGGQHHATAALQDVRKQLRGTFADQPVAVFGDADGHRLIFVRVQAANDGGGGGQGNFMFSRAAAEEHANAESFLFV